MIDQALLAQTDAMTMIAQAGDSSIYVAVLLIVIMVVVIGGLVLSSRREDAGDVPEAPKVKDPKDDIDSPNVDILDTRQTGEDPEIQAILAKSKSERTLAEEKKLRMARVSDGTTRRETAVEATQKSEEAHANIEVSEASDDASTPSEEPDAPVVSAEAPEEDELSEVSASDEVSEDGVFDDDSWADASSILDEFDDDDDDEPIAAKPEPKAEPKPKAEPVAAAAAPAQKSMNDGLAKTKAGFGRRLKDLFSKEELDDDLKEQIEEFLYTSDIGTAATRKVLKGLDALDDTVKKDPQAVWDAVRAQVTSMLKNIEKPMVVEAKEDGPFVILVVGVNGAGKTTSIGKMASKYKHEGKSVMLVAGDTFRAAAVEQLEVWARRVAIPVHKGESEADPASVVFDGIKRAKEEGIDVVLCDTSGRLHTNANLMDELKKIHRVSGKAMEGAPHETLLVLDANTGQNAIQQAKDYGAALGLTGLVLTKLDGTARGGVILGIGEEVSTPVRYIGIGEGVEDLRAFDAEEFVDALFL